jgi:hypothetical protein
MSLQKRVMHHLKSSFFRAALLLILLGMVSISLAHWLISAHVVAIFIEGTGVAIAGIGFLIFALALCIPIWPVKSQWPSLRRKRYLSQLSLPADLPDLPVGDNDAEDWGTRGEGAEE